jgi:Phytanoyl-CoA dioxygenase (PhyH)
MSARQIPAEGPGVDEGLDPRPFVERLARDGFVMLPRFFPPDMAEKARRELEAWYGLDLEERRERGVTDPHFDGTAGHSILTRPSHLLIDLYGKCPTLDRMFEALLVSALSRSLVRALGGKHIKTVGINCRWMTGAHDPPPAHDWHRDSPGAFNVGILLTDVPAGDNGATRLIPGSQWYPYNPIHHTLFSERYEGLPVFRRLNIFNRVLDARMKREAVEVVGQQGDVYLFSNELWHGRSPNLHGHRTMVILSAFYPRHFPFPSKVRARPPEELAKMPEALRPLYEPDGPSDPDEQTLVNQFVAKTGHPRSPRLFHLVRLERRFAEWWSRAWPRLRQSFV